MSTQRPRCVVVVDDDPSMRQALARMLRLAGYSTRTFASAEALLETIAASSADCMVLDVHLPGLSGRELYRRLASMGVAPPVVFISAYDEPDAVQSGAQATAALLSKPFSGYALIAEIRKAMGEQAPRCEES